NLKAALASVGADFRHLVKINNYLVDIAQNMAAYREVREQYLDRAVRPASTTIGVPALARPGGLFEVEAIAVLPAKAAAKAASKAGGKKKGKASKKKRR